MTAEKVRAHMEKGRQALRSSRTLLDSDDAEGSINRTYYAAYHAATAALLCVGEEARTHKGTHLLFQRRFVKTGQFPKRLGGLATRAQELRERADYKAITRFDTAAAEDLLREIEAFVEEAEALIRRIEAENTE